MTDDEVERALARLERHLDALQLELEAAVPAAPDAHPPAAAPSPSQSAGPGDPLERFGVELRRLARELVAAYDRVLAHERRVRAAYATTALADTAPGAVSPTRTPVHDRHAPAPRAPAPRGDTARDAVSPTRTLVLETRAELGDLADLERALSQSSAIAAVRLRAYAAGHASLAVELASRGHPGTVP